MFMILRILKYGAPELRAENQPVEVFNGELEELVKNMFDTMYGSPGIGLAAPQVGINIQLVAIDLSVGEDASKKLVICNPRITQTEGTQRGDEGCLSVPDFSESVTRPMKVTVEAQDLQGEAITIEADDLLARCLCHEIDHLHGILFVDHLSPLKKTLIRNKIKKLTKAGEW
jgi:peptide deformylase